MLSLGPGTQQRSRVHRWSTGHTATLSSRSDSRLSVFEQFAARFGSQWVTGSDVRPGRVMDCPPSSPFGYVCNAHAKRRQGEAKKSQSQPRATCSLDWTGHSHLFMDCRRCFGSQWSRCPTRPRHGLPTEQSFRIRSLRSPRIWTPRTLCT